MLSEWNDRKIDGIRWRLQIHGYDDDDDDTTEYSDVYSYRNDKW